MCRRGRESILARYITIAHTPELIIQSLHVKHVNMCKAPCNKAAILQVVSKRLLLFKGRSDVIHLLALRQAGARDDNTQISDSLREQDRVGADLRSYTLNISLPHCRKIQGPTTKSTSYGSETVRLNF